MPQVNRKELVTALNALRLTVAVTEEFPILAAVHFGPGGLTTFDGTVALQVPFTTELVGCVSFSQLFAWVKKIRAQEVTIEFDGTWADVSAGTSNVRFGLIAGWPLDRWPVFGDNRPLHPQWHAALCLAERCRGLDINAPWRLGITAATSLHATQFFASNDVTMATGVALCEQGQDIEPPMILPTRLLDVAVAMKVAPVAVTTNDRWHRFTYPDDRGTLLCLKTKAQPNVARFVEIDPGEEWDCPFVDLDGEFAAAVQRICDVHKIDDVIRLEVSTGGGGLRLDASGAGVVSKEVLQVETRHETRTVTVNARRLSAVIDGATALRLIDGRLLLKHEFGAIVMATLA